MPVRSYHTVNGQIVGETQGGNLPLRTTYFHDALGSVIATTNQYGIAKNAIRYSDWGAINFQNSGWGAMRYGWVGGWGYRSLGPVHSDTYVRRRVVSTTEGRWTTRDLLWPGQQGYSYCFGSPALFIDPSGNAPIASIGLGPKWRWDGPWVSGNQGTLHDCIAKGLNTHSCNGFTAAQQAKLSHMVRCIIGCETDDFKQGQDPMRTDHGKQPRTPKQKKYWNVGPSRINGDCQNNQFSFPYQDWTTDLCDNIADGVALLCYAVGRNGFSLPGYWSQDAPCYSRCMKNPPYSGR